MTRARLREIDCVLVLYGDPADAPTRAILGNAKRLRRDVIGMSLAELVTEAQVGATWEWRGSSIDPGRTALVNRLAAPDGAQAAPAVATPFRQQQIWRWLSREVPRFAYASSVPSATSMIGCHGSLLDQWSDLPALMGDLRVPVHARAGSHHALSGDAYAVDPWRLYSLGRRLRNGGELDAKSLVYVRPNGGLVHIAQVGGLMMFANAPPTMTPAQHEAIVRFANGMARVADSRILEHAFFVGDGPPVFYSTYPVPVVTGQHPAYADLLIEGLADDIERRHR
jgi:hypothetical protein